ncbi:carbonic anhydrase [Tamaricihabitans halophyticus]|uniref:carbonic anhydrase n=1 Tax=Tamaricihabitans halophyticus TaxID=1262583 RepID=A0A4R2QMM4_9PSEU|nr:bifunctional SulP family inorganic anion transporter/carbonic anhydrase [Tamaricihabitans halophyticus]TCP50810.1 carbonic anhydrase [Tamaricihabitans halophyticus]
MANPSASPPTGMRERARSWITQDLRYDVPASLVVFLVAIPLSLGIAVASGAPVTAGLIAAAVGGIIAGALGGSALQVSGPAAGLTVIVAGLVQQFGWAVTCAITVAAGLLQILLGMSRVARAALAISPTVVHAMLAGIGLTIVLGQLHVLLGGSAESDPIQNVLDLPSQLLNLHGTAAYLGLAVIAILLVWPRMPAKIRAIPGPLVAVIGVTLVAELVSANVDRVALPGSVLDAITLPELPSNAWGAVLLGVFTMTIIASVESLLSAVAVDKMRPEKKANLDRELVGQGAANTVSGMLGGLPVTGVIVRSATNVRAGARTKASAILHGVWVVAFALLLVDLIERIPMAVLAGLLVVIGMQLVKLADIKTALAGGEFLVYVATVLGVLALNLLEGVLIGLALSVLLMLRRVVWAQVRAERAERTHPDAPEHWIVVVEGTLSFLSIPRLSRVLGKVPARSFVELELVVDFLDHAAYEHLTVWKRQHEAAGGSVLVDEVGLASFSGAESATRKPLGRVLPRWFSPWSSWQAATGGKELEVLPPALRPLVTGVRDYHRRSAPLMRDMFSDLRDGQNPHALFLTCADSRVVPNVITSSGPGDLFTVRNIGNLVPPPAEPASASVLAPVHFAVEQLGVSTVLVCGHSGCGAMSGLIAGAGDQEGPVGDWLRWGVPSLEAMRTGHPVSTAAAADGWSEVDQLAMVNVVTQVRMLAQLPIVRGEAESQPIRVVGLFFDIASAQLLILNEEQDRFVAMPGGEARRLNLAVEGEPS